MSLAAVAAVLGALAGAVPAPAQASDTYLITGNVRRCVDCSLREHVRPLSVRYRVSGRTWVLRRISWRDWGARTARGSGVLAATGGLSPRRASITAFVRRRHIPDGCTRTAADRIYRRVRITFRRGGRARSVTVALPGTGCETF